MTSDQGIRNFIHYKFNCLTGFDFKKYGSYLNALQNIGVTEIEHAGKDMNLPIQKERLRDSVNCIHDLGMKASFYTGVFGTENIINKPHLEQYVQKDITGALLSYSGSGHKAAMMCPASSYVQEYTIPQLSGVLESTDIDTIFIDIPWIMKGGCYCHNCHGLKKDGANNSYLVKMGLEKVITSLKRTKPSINISVNASAPTIHDNSFSGAHFENLVGLFDEYLTEWNPYRWNQDTSVVTRCIEYAKSKVDTKLFHATTITDKNKKMYSLKEYENLFGTIIKAGASLRLGMTLPEKQLQIIGDAYKNALERS